jgi:hypothetical protein
LGERRADRIGVAWEDPGFWDAVQDEVRVETLDWPGFAAFMDADDPSSEPDPLFTASLREHLRRLVRKRYSS